MLKPATSLPGELIQARYYPQVASCDICELAFLFEYFLGRRRDGLFVDVGAYDGFTFSNTFGLAMVGWRGLCIEPNPESAARCRAVHAPHDVAVIEVAITSPGVASRTFELAGPLTTSNHELADESRSMPWAQGKLLGQRAEIPATTLPALLEERGVPHDFDVLAIDVEGNAAEVLYDFERWAFRPRMLIVELFDLHPDLLTLRRADRALLLRLQGAGYEVQYKDTLNTVLVRDDAAAAAYARE